MARLELPARRAAQLAAKKSKFSRWLDDYGIVKVAKAVGVGRLTVSYWKRRAQGRDDGFIPNEENAAKLVKLSAGALTLDDILRPDVR